MRASCPQLLTAAGFTAVGVALAPNGAHAQIAEPFASRVTVDSAYVTGAVDATDIAFAGDGRALVTVRDGGVLIRRADGTTVTQAGAFGTVDFEREKGLLGVVAHPGVAQNGIFFFYVSNGETELDKNRVYRGTLAPDQDQLIVDLQNPVIAASAGNGPGIEGLISHNAGGLWIHDHQLYVGVGDTGHGPGTSKPTNKYSSCLNKPNGKILRVNFDGSIPEDNPLVNVPLVTACDSFNGPWTMAAPDTRVLAWGLRNPFRFAIDPKTGMLWIGDVGEKSFEEVTVGSPGQHFGYPFMEANRDWGATDGVHCNEGFMPMTGCHPPVHDYSHSGSASVTGGLILESCGWSTVFDGKPHYLFADYQRRWIHALELTPDRMGVVDGDSPTEFGAFSQGRPVALRKGPDQALYVIMNNTGEVVRIAPNSLDDVPCDPVAAPGTGGTGGTEGVAGSTSGGAGQGGEPSVPAPVAGTGGDVPTPQAGAGGTPLSAAAPSTSSGCSVRPLSPSREIGWLAAGLSTLYFFRRSSLRRRDPPSVQR